MTTTQADTQSDDLNALAKGGRTNILGFFIRLAGRMPFLFIAGRVYGAEITGRFALAVLVVELAALIATLGLKRGLAQALSHTGRPHSHVVADALVVALFASVCASALLFVFPEVIYPNSQPTQLERLLPVIVFALAWSDVAFSALAYRHNVGAQVTARAIVEPWTISIAAMAFSYITIQEGLILSYVAATLAMLAAAMVPLIRMYGVPVGWKPHPVELAQLAQRNAPLAGADAIEWASRNIDRFILGLLFPPAFVGIYYMAQQVATLAQKFKTTFDPILGPVVTRSLAAGDKLSVAKQVRQVAFWIIAVQAAVAIALGVTSDGVMGLVGPSFVAGSGALCILLAAEVLAATGSVSESALVYVARHRNLMISVFTLGLQVALSFAFVLLLRDMGWPEAYQAVGPALALAVSLTIGSVLKGVLLSRMLGASTSGLRLGLFAAIVACAGTGVAISKLPEWAQLTIGIPLMLAAYFLVLLKTAFGDEDKALFRKMPRDQDPVVNEIP
ncbi:oligosaccharide flippase family protein [Sphingomonas canadensis]|uniref:Oligosaccharide flippase family protein n=1 Tax=Sphingomonas canadensis TaxID=1219257 RepID=A0ABW3H4T7_9SPHN|nr:lipopolysaccharide biosynthesis protein [Sphingomonas canadensis]MCW3834937.1 lipopolysaccharide biosynthesis protein [Sphingomonas canadensis]